MSWITYQTGRFAWSCHRRRAVSHVAFEGELDLHAVHIAEAELSAALVDGPTTVVLALERLTYLDSAGLSLLIRMKSDVESRSGRVFIGRHSPMSQRLVEVTGLTEWFAPTDAFGAALVPCPICDEEISPLTRTCDHCGGAL
jgi:anti-anti-sigma factor